MLFSSKGNQRIELQNASHLSQTLFVFSVGGLYLFVLGWKRQFVTVGQHEFHILLHAHHLICLSFLLQFSISKNLFLCCRFLLTFFALYIPSFPGAWAF
mmetsp:Transcript_15304/g.27202  ORF Transcript_15304/g.27202 Transcript_15304/m.27202 type:complete len:99 (+) Transcript_15304:71-367(+)